MTQFFTTPFYFTKPKDQGNFLIPTEFPGEKTRR